jgi:hypothetical protein
MKVNSEAATSWMVITGTMACSGNVGLTSEWLDRELLQENRRNGEYGRHGWEGVFIPRDERQ